MTRKLQDRLALASYKTQHGLDKLSFTMVEAQFNSNVNTQRRAGSSVVSSGSSSSSTSSDMIPYSRAFQSSPITAPVFSDDVYPEDHQLGSRKKARFQAHYTAPTPTSSVPRSRNSRNVSQSSPVRTRRSRAGMHPASSPLDTRFSSDFRTAHGPNLSFVSTSSTISESPTFGHSSENEAPMLPTAFHGSPPRTPPPTRSRGARIQRDGTCNGDKGAADALMQLMTSPSPARGQKSASKMFPPSTPPSKNVDLPSSMLNTPGGGNQGNFTGFTTPGQQQFNFSDFVNVTPSPAQGAFNRTPGPARTPLAARDARRRLNFDSLQPPAGSPSSSRIGGGGGSNGMVMELGGELNAQ